MNERMALQEAVQKAVRPVSGMEEGRVGAAEKGS